jgi:hypothetical protein
LEFVAGDMSKPGDLDSAFGGASHLFAVTQFWDPASMGKEVEIGGFIADSAKKAYVPWKMIDKPRKNKKIRPAFFEIFPLYYIIYIYF